MNFTQKAVKALSLASLATALCFASVVVPAQTAVAPAASMPAGQMQHKGSAGASGAKDMPGLCQVLLHVGEGHRTTFRSVTVNLPASLTALNFTLSPG